MESKKTVSKHSVQIGSSSLLLIFTVICLVVFSTLSLSSANVDRGLALKNEKSIKTFYEADGKGEELKKKVNNKIIEIYNTSIDEKDFQLNLKKQFDEAFEETDNSIKYTINAGSEQFLLVELKICGYEDIKPNKQNFAVMSWAIQNKVDYQIDESINVMGDI